MNEKEIPPRLLIRSSADLYERCELPTGACELICPSAMSIEDLVDMEEWLQFFVTKLRRRFKAASVETAAPFCPSHEQDL